MGRSAIGFAAAVSACAPEGDPARAGAAGGLEVYGLSVEVNEHHGSVLLARWTQTAHPQVSAAGDTLLVDQQLYWATFGLLGALSTVVETRLDGEVRTVSTPGLQHPFTQLPDGTLAWGQVPRPDQGEQLVELAPGAAEPKVVWRCDELEGWHPEHPCRSNSLSYRPETDSYLFSFYTESTVVEIARGGADASGEAVWWAGLVDDGFGFDPTQGRFYWQHGVSYTDAGTLLVSGFSGSTLLLEYAVVPDTRTLELLWWNDAGVVADYGGDAERLPNGNTLHVVGSAGVVREVDPAGAEVWRLSYGDGLLLGSGELVEDLYALVAPPP